MRRGRKQRSEAEPGVTLAEDVAEGKTDILIQEFVRLEPVIARLIGTYRPPTLRDLAFRAMRTPNEFKVDYLQLLATLDALEVSYPSEEASNDEWYDYLVYLKLLATWGDLDRARSWQ